MTKQDKLILEAYNRNILNEGLISSWDINKLHKTLKSKFKNNIEIKLPTEYEMKYSSLDYERYSFVVIISEDFYNQNNKAFNKILNLFGYHISFKRKDENDFIFNIEPKFPVKIDKELNKLNIKYFYHITHRSNYNNIKKIGLTPRETETMFNHNGNRIYLFYSSDIKIVKGILQALANGKNKPANEFIIFKTPCDTNKYDYYLDDLTTDILNDVVACFILKNISPQNLEFIKIKNL